MRIIRKEIRKILSIKLIVILLIFSVLYVTQIPYIAMNWWNHTASPYEVDLHRELIGKFGATLTIDEWDEFMLFRQDLIDDLMEYILQDETMQKYGIDTYEKYEEQRELTYHGEAHETELGQEYTRLIFDDPVTSPLNFKIQTIDSLVAAKESGYIYSSIEDAENKMHNMDYYQNMSESAQNRIVQLWTGTELSLLHAAVTENVKDDFVRMAILAVIWCFVLILPYQISERLKNVRDIQLTTKTGRKIFGKQAVISVLLGALIGVMVSAVYAYLLWRKGAFDFIHCPINIMMIRYWVDMTYGQFLLLYAGELIMTSVVSALLAYLIGRLSVNYIIGLGISIPITVALCVAVNFIMITPLHLNISKMISFFLLCIPLIILPIAVLLLTGAMLRRDRVRDIL